MKFGPRSARKLAKAYLRPGDSVMDIGAADGFYTAIYAEAIGRDGAVIAVEPLAENRLAFYERIARMREVPSISVLPYVALDRSGEMHQLHLNGEPKHASLFAANVADSSRHCEVESRTVDNLWQVLPNRPRLIQVDAQGAEALIVRGASHLIKAKRTVWVIEIWPHGLRNAGASVDDVFMPFQRLGYKPHNIRNLPMTWKQIDVLCRREKTASHFDVVMVPPGLAA